MRVGVCGAVDSWDVRACRFIDPIHEPQLHYLEWVETCDSEPPHKGDIIHAVALLHASQKERLAICILMH